MSIVSTTVLKELVGKIKDIFATKKELLSGLNDKSDIGHIHNASEITLDESHRFVTDIEKSTWDSKASTDIATTLSDGLLSSSDKSKLDSVSEGAQKNSDITKLEIEAKLTGNIESHSHETVNGLKFTIDENGDVYVEY